MARRWMIVAMGLCVLAAGTGGCKTLDDYNKVVAAADRATEQWDKCQADAQAVRAENQRLLDELALRDGSASGKDTRIAALNAENARLLADLVTLNEMYQKLAKRPPQLGGVLLPPTVNAALVALADANSDLMEFLPRHGMLKLKADLTFDKGSAVVKAKAVEALTKLATITNATAAKQFHIYVAGHTDDIPLKNPNTIALHGSNWGLSAHRALAVVKEICIAGVEQKRMAGMGFSMYHPVADNKPGKKGNPANRRVEIWIVPPDRFLSSGGN